MFQETSFSGASPPLPSEIGLEEPRISPVLRRRSSQRSCSSFSTVTHSITFRLFLTLLLLLLFSSTTVHQGKTFIFSVMQSTKKKYPKTFPPSLVLYSKLSRRSFVFFDILFTFRLLSSLVREQKKILYLFFYRFFHWTFFLFWESSVHHICFGSRANRAMEIILQQQGTNFLSPIFFCFK